nr:MAG TPA: hypothetical protein [Caudoviricetes sp.]
MTITVSPTARNGGRAFIFVKQKALDASRTEG